MKKNKKEEFIDDGRTIADMDIEGMPHRKDKNRQASYDVTKEEKRHLIMAGYKAFLPLLICSLVGITLTFILIYFWLH